MSLKTEQSAHPENGRSVCGFKSRYKTSVEVQMKVGVILRIICLQVAYTAN
jgi:hypothetical protein